MGRRRKVKAAEDTSEVRTVTRTAASQMPMMEEDRILQHIATIEGIQRQQVKWAEQLTRAKQVIKAEGMNPKSILNAIKHKKADALQLRRDAEEQAHVNKVIGMPFQMTVYDVAFASPIDQAKAEARAAAGAGRPPENKWAEGTPECDAYREEYARIQAGMAAGLAAAEMTEEEILAAMASDPGRGAPPPPPPPAPQMDIEEFTVDVPLLGDTEKEFRTEEHEEPDEPQVEHVE